MSKTTTMTSEQIEAHIYQWAMEESKFFQLMKVRQGAPNPRKFVFDDIEGNFVEVSIDAVSSEQWT